MLLFLAISSVCSQNESFSQKTCHHTKVVVLKSSSMIVFENVLCETVQHAFLSNEKMYKTTLNHSNSKRQNKRQMEGT